MRYKARPTVTFLPATASLLALWVLLATLAFYLSPTDAPLTWIICLTGNIVGIPLGMLASPLKNEGLHFRVLGSWIATFASGYLLSKFDLGSAAGVFANDLALGRVLLFLAFLILGSVQTFVLRSYLDVDRPRDFYSEDDPESAAAAEPKK
jgi:hypothetical protein